MSLPEEYVLLRHQAPYQVGISVLFEERSRVVAAIAQLHGGIARESLQECQTAARVAYHQGLPRFAGAGFGQLLLSRDEQGQHAKIVMEQAPGRKGERLSARRGKGLHEDPGVLAW